MIDLHCHSNYSDGLLSPALLLARAKQAGISLLALTDHDTVAGVLALQQMEPDPTIRIIPGIELSAHWKKYDVHILGLNINVHAPELQAIIIEQQERRVLRAQAIGEALQRCGIADAYAKTCELAGDAKVGRAHYAQLLIKEGYVRDIKAAFKTYLGKGKVAYVPVTWINLKTAVQVIQAAGGQAVIAHPLKYKLTRTKLHEFLQEFKDLGGAGIEVVSGESMPDDIDKMSKLCEKFSLLASSGSDYHGEGLSRIALGRQKLLPNDCVPIWSAWGVVGGTGNESNFCSAS
ncbi:MAG: PHP domain-containing protein [Legionellales bacterium]|nr:PHP domain-containing protein [Legionellales bacterium]